MILNRLVRLQADENTPMKARPYGFTLIELLVALAVLGLLLVTLTQGMHFGMLALRTETTLAGTDSDLNTVDLVLRHLIEAMDSGSEDRKEPPLLARRDTMTFIADLPNGAGPNDVGPNDVGDAFARQVEATLFVDGRHRLILRWRPFRRVESLTATQPFTETELLAGVSRMDLSFWRRSGGWIDRWRFIDLPTMIRVRLVLTGGKKRHWPDIVAAPLLARS